MPGYPIRTPWDHSLVDSSPRPIAASHVLHRLLVPRHPPFALDNLTTKNKMLASTVQFSTNDQPTTPQKTPALPQQSMCLPDRAWYRNNNPSPSSRSEAPPPTGAGSVVLSGPNRVPIIIHQPHQPPISATLTDVYSGRRPLPVVD